MSLVNEHQAFIDYRTGYNPRNNATDLFDKAERRIKAKKSFLEDTENELQLLQEQALKLYQSKVYYASFPEKLMQTAQKWLLMKKKGTDADGNKLDGRRSYKEKDYFNLLTSDLQRYFETTDFRITEIIQYNFGEAYDVYFESEGHEWFLGIPMISRIGLKTYLDYGASVFKLKICHKDSEHSYSYVGATFIEKELAEILKTGIEKYCTKEQDNA